MYACCVECWVGRGLPGLWTAWAEKALKDGPFADFFYHTEGWGLAVGGWVFFGPKKSRLFCSLVAGDSNSTQLSTLQFLFYYSNIIIFHSSYW